MRRTEIADLIVSQMERRRTQLTTFYGDQRAPYFVVDDVLPNELAGRIYAAFPLPERMMLRHSIRERKYVTSQMNRCDALAEEAVFAFQDPRLVELIGGITGMMELEPDP